MSEVKRLIERLTILTNGEALLGITFLVTGLVTARAGVIKLQDLWAQLSPHLPLSLPAGTPAQILTSLPVITAVFIGLVSSIAAVLMGGLWALSGISDVISSRKSERASLDLEDPGLVAESLRTARPQYWKSAPWLIRQAAGRMTRLRYLTPIPRGLIAAAAWNAVKFSFLALLILLVTPLIESIPFLVQRYAQIEIAFAVPSAIPLYALLWFLIILNALIAASLVPFRRPEFLRSRGALSIQGTGEPHFFLALLEESSRLLSAEGLPRRPGIRLEKTEPPCAQGTLLESIPEAAGFLVRPAGYACLPLIFFLVTMGFSRLIHFSGPTESMAHFDFLAAHGLDHLLEVLLALALMLAGFHCADWARRLFEIRKFRSALVFCVISRPEDQAKAAGSRLPSGGDRSRLPVWAFASEVDEEFVEWAKRPVGSRSFSIDMCWGEIVSEGVTGSGSRYLTEMRRSDILDENMHRIMELPFRARFEPEVAAPPLETVSSVEKT